MRDLEREPRAHDKQKAHEEGEPSEVVTAGADAPNFGRKVVLRRFQDDPEILPILDVSLGSNPSLAATANKAGVLRV